jgi:hypothetical protein
VEKAGEQSAARWAEMLALRREFHAKGMLEAVKTDRFDELLQKLAAEASTAEQSPEPVPLSEDLHCPACGNNQLEGHAKDCPSALEFLPSVGESPDKLNDECRDFFAESGSESPCSVCGNSKGEATTFNAEIERILNDLRADAAERVAAPPEPSPELKFLEGLQEFLKQPNPQAWPGGYGSYWNRRATLMWELEELIKKLRLSGESRQ